MANHLQLNLQEASSPITEELIGSHEHAPMAALTVCSLVLYLLTHMPAEKLSSSTADAQEIKLV
ncbi:COX2 oxidase, partial [Emberiza fucata]|nr:COX2 oxidase [Emberiza fucata]